MTAASHDIVFLFDVDNTLLDNDRVLADLRVHISQFGAASAERYWALFEELREELGYADYLGALQRYRREEFSLLPRGEGPGMREADAPTHDEMPRTSSRPHPRSLSPREREPVPAVEVRYVNDPRLLLMSSYLVDYPFADRLYPAALDALAHCARWGPTVLLTDGDVVFQPRKIQRAALWEAVEGRVLIYVHKEQMLADVAQRYPGRHYVMVDDKLRILAAMKAIWGERLTTVFPRQGHYALDLKCIAQYPAADLTIERIGDMLGFDLPTLSGGNTPPHS